MGFSTLNTLLVQMLGQVFQGVFVIIGTAGSTYFKNARTYFMAWNLAVALVGALVIWWAVRGFQRWRAGS